MIISISNKLIGLWYALLMMINIQGIDEDIIEEGDDAQFTAHEKGPGGKKVGISIQGLLKRFKVRGQTIIIYPRQLDDV